MRLGTSPAPLAGNRLVNGGFEQGLPVTLPGEGPAIPGWTTTGGMTFARYGAHPLRGFPSWLDAARWSGGRNVLWGGTRGPLNTAIQVVDVAAEAGAIDAGRATARASASSAAAPRCWIRWARRPTSWTPPAVAWDRRKSRR